MLALITGQHKGTPYVEINQSAKLLVDVLARVKGARSKGALEAVADSLQLHFRRCTELEDSLLTKSEVEQIRDIPRQVLHEVNSLFVPLQL